MKPGENKNGCKGKQMDIGVDQGRPFGAPVSWLRTALLWCSLLAFPVGSVFAEDNVQLLMVDAGSQHTVTLNKAAQRIAVGDGEIAQIKLLGKNELLLQGVKPGTTSLLVWAKGSAKPERYQIQVNQATDTAMLSDYPGLHLKAAGDLLMLEGSSSDMAKHEAAVQVAKHTGGTDKAPLHDASQMTYSSEVQIGVRVVELSRTVMKQAGINLLSNTSGFTFGTFASGSLSKVTLSGGAIDTTAGIPVQQAMNLVLGTSSKGLVGILSLLESNGFARTLAEPSLVAQSGQTASFLAGGEFPVPVPQALGQTTISYKPYGIRLNVSPTVLGENRIALKVAPEVSDLDFNNAVKINGVDVPALLTRRADTSVELGNGESFIIGGLVSQSVKKNLDKVPGLGDLPILGAFFKTVSLTREDKELLIIVTPKLVRPLAANSQVGPLPGAGLSGYNPSLWEMLMMSDRQDAASFSGLSR